MDSIKKVTIVGLGALGILYGSKIVDHCGNDSVCYLMDPARAKRHRRDVYSINGKSYPFRIVTPAEAELADLVIVAVKESGLLEAVSELQSCVTDATTLISVMNGISSEKILAQAFGREKVLGCTALGMDAMREGTQLTCHHFGRLRIGTLEPGQEERLNALEQFLTKADLTFEEMPNIRRAIWSKFMLNVGINQTCMVYETNYGGALKADGPAFRDMTGAMREVIRLSEAEGIGLTEKDLEDNLKVLATLDPDGIPSMRQDAVAKRKSEVGLFAGTVLQLAEKHGIAAPVNQKYWDAVQKMESQYEKR